MNVVLFNVHDAVLLLTMALYFLLGVSHLNLLSVSRLSFPALLLFCLASAAIPFDILISFGAGFRDYAVDHFPDLFYLFDLGYWVQAPLWYIFVKSVFQQQTKLSWLDVLMFLPFMFFALHQIFAFYLLSSEAKTDVLTSSPEKSFSIEYVVLMRELVRLIVFGLSVNVALRYFGKGSNEGAYVVRCLRAPWPILLTFGLFFLSCISVIDIVLIMLSSTGESAVANALGLSANYLSLILLFGVCVLAINATPLYRLSSLPQSRLQPNKAVEVKIDSGHVALIENAMQNDKLFLENNLSLERLAQHIDLPARTVSSIINQQFNCNFFEFINGYRIEEAKRMMDDKQFAQCNILDIMLETGFNNKATFNTFFKKVQGMTPREYRKRQGAG